MKLVMAPVGTVKRLAISSSAAITARPGSARTVGTLRMWLAAGVRKTTSVNVPPMSMPMLMPSGDADVDLDMACRISLSSQRLVTGNPIITAVAGLIRQGQ